MISLRSVQHSALNRSRSDSELVRGLHPGSDGVSATGVTGSGGGVQLVLAVVRRSDADATGSGGGVQLVLPCLGAGLSHHGLALASARCCCQACNVGLGRVSSSGLLVMSWCRPGSRQCWPCQACNGLSGRVSSSVMSSFSVSVMASAKISVMASFSVSVAHQATLGSPSNLL